MDLSRTRAVLLDMDGTLVASHAAVERAWGRWAGEYGVEPELAIAHAHGSTAPDTVRRLRPDLDDVAAGAAAQRQLALQYDDLADVTATAGAHELIETVHRLDLPWAVVTSADARLARARLGAAGITVPPVLITSEDVSAGKPDPQGYVQAAARLGVEPALTLVVEDSEIGARAGLAAGARVATVAGPAGQAPPAGLGADLVLPGLPRLLHLLARSRMTPWWRDAVGYQVYLPSFADSDGDGWGDLPGVTAHLDHLVGLGVDVVWLTPFFVSPMVDHGYDVADYRTVDPRWGGDGALTELLGAAHERGLKVVGDLVVNHTSDAHPWFQAAASSRSDPHRDYYHWADPGPDGGPPNNWLSHFGGPAWTLHEGAGQYYLHLFTPGQPDLNWRNPTVADQVNAISTHWYELGLDGFRIDTAAYLLKDEALRDNPILPAGQLSPVHGVSQDWRRQEHRYDVHQDQVHLVHERWRRLADTHNALLVGEVHDVEPDSLARFVSDGRLHSTFWFGLVDGGWDPALIDDLLAAAHASPALSWAQGNHDRPRAASRYGGGQLGQRRSLALHALLALLPGCLWLYQGEELGLTDGVVPAGRGADPLALVAPGQSRDLARTPMPWLDQPGLGFTTGTSWLPGGDRTAEQTVAHQNRDPASHLSALRRLLTARAWAHHHGLLAGDSVSAEPAPTGVRLWQRGQAWSAVNLTERPAEQMDLPATAIYDSQDPTITPEHPRPSQTVSLAAHQALLLAPSR